MVAIFTGAGTGFERGSGNVLGGSGLLGSAGFGRSGEQVFLNAANGNLLISRQDEFLVGRGPDIDISRTYNSLGNQSDDNGDNWRQSTDRRIFDLTGTANSWGSTVKRRSSDGSEITYSWDGTSYVATDGAGSFDRLTYNGSAWTWTDGDSRVTETYAAYGSYWRITAQADTSGNSLTYGYTGDKLTTLTTANGETLTYTWSGNHITTVNSGDGTLTRYYYDSYDRLSRVDVELTSGGAVYSTNYTYVGTSRLVATISETDGSSLTIGYDNSNRVTSLTQTVASGVTRITNIAYGTGYTDVTDPLGVVTRLEYANANLALPVETWNSGNVTSQPATIDGRAATQYTVQTAGAWSGAVQALNIAAGETITFGLTLQASGSVTSQALGLYGDTEGWGSANISSARIISGPGQLVQLSGGFWRIDGLSTTQGTRIEITRTFKQAQSGGAYFYGDHPGGYRAGTSLIVADATLVRKSAALAAGQDSFGSWGSFGGVSVAPTGSLIDGSPAYKLQLSTTGWAGSTTTLLGTASARESLGLSMSFQAVSGSATSQSFGLYGNTTGWGANGSAVARIVSGPGSVVQSSGGLWTVTGLSTTQVTRVEIIRTYDREETAAAYVYVDLPGGYRAGQAIIAGAPYVARLGTEGAQAGQLTRITTAYGTAQAQAVRFGYNANGDLASVTDATGQSSTYTYDANGNLLTSTDRLDNVITRTFNAANQLLTETRIGSDADGAAAYHTTRYAYDSAGRLRFTVSAGGDVVEYSYGPDGALSTTRTYRSKYDLNNVAMSAALAENALLSWARNVANPAEIGISQYWYDARGNTSQARSYGAASDVDTPSIAAGYREEFFTYDSAGRLLNSRIAGQSTEQFIYDGLGRLISKTDINGGITSIVFNDAATQTIVTLNNGFVQTSTYNKAGDLVSFTESGEAVAGGIASYAHDKDGRVRMMTDATGLKFYYLYDKLGRKVADINAYGNITEYQYDANNRLIATVHYENGIMGGTEAMAALNDPNDSFDMASIRPNPNGHDIWTWQVYDKEGRVVEAIEGDGSVTAYEYDASSQLVKTTGFANKLKPAQLDAFRINGPSAWLPVSDAKDSVARIFYDKAGRTIGALDGEGYLTRIAYDGAGQKILETAYANAVNPAYRASGSFQTMLGSVGANANDRTVRYIYDQQGHLRFTIDALNHVTEYVYQTGALDDAYGVVRQTIRYSGVLPALSSHSYASVKSAVAGLNGENRLSFSIYDNAGRLSYTIDAAGGVVGFAYDSLGQVTRKTEYATTWPGSEFHPKIDWDNWASSNFTSSDRVTRYYYSARGELRFAIDAEGYITRTDYDAEGRVIATVRWDSAVSVTDSWTIDVVSNAQGGNYNSESISYDPSGRLSVVSNNAGQARYKHYKANGSLEWDIVSENGQDDSRTYYAYDAAGRKVSEEAAWGTPEHAITTYTYNGLGDLISVTDPNGNATSFTYDHAGRMVTQTDALTHVTTFGYNAFGEQVSITNARGYTTYSYYDNMGRVTSTVDAGGNTTATNYTAFGEIYSVIRGSAVTSFTYDKLGRLLTTTDAEGGIETSWYDAFGNVRQVQNKLGALTLYGRDHRGLLKEEQVLAPNGDPANPTYVSNRFEYDARGNLTHKIEAYGLAEQRDTWFAYDKANRLTSKWGEAVSVGLSPTTVTPTEYYTYDTRGNLIETRDANGARTLFYYDDLNRKVATVTPAGTAAAPKGVLSTFSYDAVGNLLASRTWETTIAVPATAGGTRPGDPGGNYRETTNSYDALNRLRTSSVANQAYGYWNGNSYIFTSGTLTTTYDYDAVGNLVRTTGPDGAAIYSYFDLLDRKTAQVDAAGYPTSWSYDAEGNVLSERRYTGQASGVSISGFSPPAQQGDDRVTTFEYDRMGRRVAERRFYVEAWSLNPANGQLSGANGSSVIRYTYNALGEVTTKTEATGDVTGYTYDNAGRLIQETRPAIALTGGGTDTPTLRYYYNGLDQLSMTRQGGASLSGNDRTTTNLYDGAGRLIGVTDALGQTRSYVYDAAGRKVGEYYTRELGNGASAGAGTTVVEGISYEYDLAGNVIRQAVNTISGGTWSAVSHTQSSYSAFGDLTSRGTNGGSQEQFFYDSAAHLIRSNAGDGVWRAFVYDAAGRQTLSVESNGTTDLSSMSQATAVSLIAGGTVTATATLFDARGQATQSVQMLRQLAAGGPTQNLITRRSYTAFGEVAWEQDALGRQTDYSYNTMGRVVQVQRPTVSVTSENGTVSSIRPTEKMFYDIAGRLIGTQDANSVWLGWGVKTTRQLVAGTGFGDSEALVAKEWHADGGAITNGYDVFGNQTVVTDEIGRTTAMGYDKLGRLIQVTRPATAAGTLVEYYSYDTLGNRLGHWNNAGLGQDYAGRERTEYDALGRIVLQKAFGGDTTTSVYTWSSGLATYGAWATTATYANGLQSVSNTDIFGRLISKTDLGGHATSVGYDLLGRMTGRTTTGNAGTETASYVWLNNGQVGSISIVSGGVTTTQNSSYDLVGNKLTEYQVRAGVVIENAAATYDALDRLVTWSEAGNTPSVTPPATSTYEYDANSNVRRTLTYFRSLDHLGGASSIVATQDRWYSYDTMNRMVIAEGSFTGARGSGSIGIGAKGTALTYDTAGQRRTASSIVNGLIWTGHIGYSLYGGPTLYADDDGYIDQSTFNEYNWEGYVTTTYSGLSVETYSYDGRGSLLNVSVSQQIAHGYGGTELEIYPGEMDSPANAGTYTYDLLGRMTRQMDYTSTRFTVTAYDRQVVYDAANRIASDTIANRKNTDIFTTVTTYGYGSGSGYALGAVVTANSKVYKNNNDAAAPDTFTTNSYAWFDGAVQSGLVNTLGSTTYSLTPTGAVRSASVSDGRPHTVTMTLDAYGQTIRRDEADNSANGDPHEIWYRFNGREMGHVGNDGTLDVSYTLSTADRTVPTGTGAFHNGGIGGAAFAEFGEAHAAYTSYAQGASGGSYTVQQGETLQSIAAQLWGDSNLWYKLADANGLSGGGILSVGQRLVVPSGVTRTSNTASTFKPYDPTETLGSVAPTTPRPQQKKGCGTLGSILLVVVAVAVTLLLKAPVTSLLSGGATAGAGSAAAIGGAAIAGAAGSAASQTFGVATGIQDKFSWKGVALAGFGAGIGQGLGAIEGLSKIASSPFLGDVVRGALGSTITQGIGMATGLQSKFDFAGVAAAGLGAGVSGAIKLDGFAGTLGRNTAGGLANAAARSLIDGTDFGDNILAVLPDAIANTIGQLAAEGIASADRRSGGGSGRASGGGDASATEALDGEIVVTGRRADSTKICIGGPPMMAAFLAQVSLPTGEQDPERKVENGQTLVRVWNETTKEYQWTPEGNGPENSPTRWTADGNIEANVPSEPESGGFFDWLFGDWEWPTVSLNQWFAGQPSLDAGIRVRMAGGDREEASAAQRQGTRNFITQGFGNLTFGLWETNLGFTSTAAAPPTILMTERSSSPYIVTGGRNGFVSSPWWGWAAEAAFAKFGTPLAAETKLAGGKFDLGVTGSQYTLKAPIVSGFEGATGTVNTRAFVVHGNSAASPRTAYLYELYQADGTFLKNGITQNMNARYTKAFMEDKYMIEVAKGPRKDMLILERQKTVANPGPLNNEPWAVKARNGQ